MRRLRPHLAPPGLTTLIMKTHINIDVFDIQARSAQIYGSLLLRI